MASFHDIPAQGPPGAEQLHSFTVDDLVAELVRREAKDPTANDVLKEWMTHQAVEAKYLRKRSIGEGFRIL